MDDNLPDEANEETSDTGEESGPLGRLLDQSIGSGAAESETATQISNQSSQPNTDYSAGTHEHDDDNEG